MSDKNNSYKKLPKNIKTKFSNLKLIGFDVDGVLTRGDIVIDSQANEYKFFNCLDGHGIKLLLLCGIKIALITARQSKPVEIRAKELGITDLVQKCDDKAQAISEIQKKYFLSSKQCAFVGDDVIDLPAMNKCGLKIAVANSHEYLQQQVDIVLSKNGGNGAVRQVCDFTLLAQGKYENIYGRYK